MLDTSSIFDVLLNECSNEPETPIIGQSKQTEKFKENMAESLIQEIIISMLNTKATEGKTKTAILYDVTVLINSMFYFHTKLDNYCVPVLDASNFSDLERFLLEK